MPVVLLRHINAWINRRTVDQGGLVPLVHVALAALDWPSLPSSLPSRVAAVIDGEGRCANWTSHSDWRRAVVRLFKAIRLCIHERRGLSDVAMSGHMFVTATVMTQRPRPFSRWLPDGSLRSRTLVAVFGRYTDLLGADNGGAYYTQVYRFLYCHKNLRLGCVLYSMAYYIRSLR